MSLKQRAQQHGKERGMSYTQGDTTNTATAQAIRLFEPPAVAIVDGEIVQAWGLTDQPGMSLAVICGDEDTGHFAPVPYHEARVFRNITRQALQVLLETERGQTRTRQNQ